MADRAATSPPAQDCFSPAPRFWGCSPCPARTGTQWALPGVILMRMIYTNAEEFLKKILNHKEVPGGPRKASRQVPVTLGRGSTPE